MLQKILFLLSINFLCINFLCSKNFTQFVVIIPSYNNEQWCIKNIESVLNQNYDNFKIIYINDCSIDKTGELVENYINTHAKKNNFKLINNSTRCGALKNIYDTVNNCEENEVIILVDGDDWLNDKEVLSYLDSVYQDKNIWLTYGQFIGYPCNTIGWCRDFPEEISINNLYRKYNWVASHLRTFYCGLFKKIKVDDLKYQNKFFDVAWDLSFMLPMIEMCTNKHFKCIDRILYAYNIQNPISDFRINSDKQNNCELYIRNLKPYEPIDKL